MAGKQSAYENNNEGDGAKKYESLVACLRTYESAIIAFSGGVDSTFLARVAKQ